MNNLNRVGLYDVDGTVMARIEADSEGRAVLTLLAPSSDGLPPQEIIMFGDSAIEGLIHITSALRNWEAPRPPVVSDSSVPALLTVPGG
jgi:hypothetical protein